MSVVNTVLSSFSYDDVMSELKNRAITFKYEKEIFKNKLSFVNVMSELQDHVNKHRVKPSQIRSKNKYGLLYNYFIRFLY